MRNDPTSATLFSNQEELEDVTWKTARIILTSRRLIATKIPSERIQDLSDAMLRWCEQYGLNAEHMRWLEQQVCDHGLENPSTATLRNMLLQQFRPDLLKPKHSDDLEQKIERWKAIAKCKYCADSGKLLPRAQLPQKAPDEFCPMCGEGEARRKLEAEAAPEQPVMKTRRTLSPPTFRFSYDGRILPPKRPSPRNR